MTIQHVHTTTRTFLSSSHNTMPLRSRHSDNGYALQAAKPFSKRPHLAIRLAYVCTTARLIATRAATVSMHAAAHPLHVKASSQ